MLHDVTMLVWVLGNCSRKLFTMDILTNVKFVLFECVCDCWLLIFFFFYCFFLIAVLHLILWIIIILKINIFWRRYISHSHLLDIMHASIFMFLSILVLIFFKCFLFSFLLWQAAEKLRALPDVHYKLKDKPADNSDQWKKPKEIVFRIIMSADGYLWYMVLQ